MPKIIQGSEDLPFVRMRRNFSLTISFDDRKEWAKIDQFEKDCRRFDCRVVGTHKRSRISTPGHREEFDELAFRETLLRSTGRAALLATIKEAHGATIYVGEADWSRSY